MDIKKLQALVIDALEDVKAQDIKVYDTTKLTGLFDRLCFASGTSNRQTKALASSVREKVKENGGEVIGMEGEGTGEWVLVDLGDMVVHIMQPAIRDYYRLEELWGEHELKLNSRHKAKSVASIESSTTQQITKPVRSRVTRASSNEEAPAKPTRTRKTTGRSASADEAKQSTPRKSATKLTSKTAATTKKSSASKRPTAKSKSA